MAITHPTLHSPLKRKRKDVSLEMSSHAEKEFFKHRHQSKFHKITNDSVEVALTFLKKQTMANCPCQIHTASRGYDWVVFRRQPDRTPTFYYEMTESESEDEDHDEDDDDYFSVEPVDIDEENKEDHTYCEKNPDVTGAASSEKITSDGLDETPEKSEPGEASSIHSREEEEKNSQKTKSLKERKKIWTQRTLMILKTRWVL